MEVQHAEDENESGRCQAFQGHRFWKNCEEQGLFKSHFDEKVYKAKKESAEVGTR
jgi:hypothetical protein